MLSSGLEFILDLFHCNDLSFEIPDHSQHMPRNSLRANTLVVPAYNVAERFAAFHDVTKRFFNFESHA